MYVLQFIVKVGIVFKNNLFTVKDLVFKVSLTKMNKKFRNGCHAPLEIVWF